MTSVLNVDTIADKAGTGPVGLTKQSAAKAWVTKAARFTLLHELQVLADVPIPVKLRRRTRELLQIAQDVLTYLPELLYPLQKQITQVLDGFEFAHHRQIVNSASLLTPIRLLILVGGCELVMHKLQHLRFTALTS